MVPRNFGLAADFGGQFSLRFRGGPTLNVAPTGVADTNTTNELTTLNVAAPGVLANDTDPNVGDVLTVTQVNGVTGNVGVEVTGSTGGKFTINADGSYVFNPNWAFQALGVGASRDTSATYRVSDGEGGHFTTTLTITVTGVNQAPTSGTLSPQSSLDSQVISLNVSGSFSDIDVGDTLTFTATGLPTGLSIAPATGVISGTIASNASVSSPFSVVVTATDNHGATRNAGFTWTVEPVSSGLTANFLDGTVGTGTWAGGTRFVRASTLIWGETTTARFEAGLDSYTEGLMLEGANVGLLTMNTAFDNAAWNKNRATITVTADTDVIGPAANAMTFTEDTATNTHTLTQPLSVAAGDIPDNQLVTTQYIVRPFTSGGGDTVTEMPYVAIMTRDKGNGFPVQYFKIDPDDWHTHTTKAFSGAVVAAKGIEYLGLGFFRIWVSVDIRAGVTVPMSYLMGVDAAGENHNYAGTSRRFQVCGAHANYGAWPQRFFAVGAARELAKGADQLTYPATDIPFNDFFVNIPFVQRDFARHSGTAAERVLFQSGNFKISLTDNDVIVDFAGNILSGAFAVAPDGIVNLAVGKGPVKGVEIYVNGAMIASNNSAPFLPDIARDVIYVGANASAGSHAEVLLRSLNIAPWSA